MQWNEVNTESKNKDYGFSATLWIDAETETRLKQLSQYGLNSSLPTALTAVYLNCHPHTLSDYSGQLMKEFQEKFPRRKRQRYFVGSAIQFILLYKKLLTKAEREEAFNILWNLIVRFGTIDKFCSQNNLNELINESLIN